MSFDDMARVNGVFYWSGAHLGFHLRARVVYKSLFYTQTLDTHQKRHFSSLSLPSHVFSLSLLGFHVLKFNLRERDLIAN